MSSAPLGNDVATVVNTTVGPDVNVKFLVCKENPDIVTPVIGDSVAEIGFSPSTVDRLRAALHELHGGQRS